METRSSHNFNYTFGTRNYLQDERRSCNNFNTQRTRNKTAQKGYHIKT